MDLHAATQQEETRLRAHLREMAGGQDTRGIEIAHGIRVLGNLFDAAVSRSAVFGEISGPRLNILLRLLMEENRGNSDGLKPSRLSRLQGVKKNTITALLHGLEERGLIERVEHPTDRRAFLIRITLSGRQLVLSSAPARFAFMDQLTAVLNNHERDELIRLMDKLRAALLTHNQTPPDC